MEENNIESIFTVIVDVLSRTNEKHWLGEFKNYLTKIKRATFNKSEYLQMFGGMGSLNDLILCGMNKHNITKKQEPWVNELFTALLSITNNYASNNQLFIKTVITPLEKYSSQIQGWRCLDCGYSEILNIDQEYFLARYFVRNYIGEYFENKKLAELVNNCFNPESDDLNILRNKLAKIIKQSKIETSSREGMMRPCPFCKGNNTAIYRWDLVKKPFSIVLFNPSENNLKVKKINA